MILDWLFEPRGEYSYIGLWWFCFVGYWIGYFVRRIQE